MNQKKFLGAVAAGLAICAALVALVAAPAGAVSAGRTRVTVRIEGLKKELLATRTVKVPVTGWITKGGTPKRKCPAASAAGALNVATHHKWGAKYSSSVGGTEITSILGEAHPFTSKYYWGIWVNNRLAQVGACELKPRRGEQLLFAAVADTANPFPIKLTAPSHATAGKPFDAKVVWWPAKGPAKALSGARVDGVKTNSHGIAKITAHKAGKLALRATRTGYIRSALVTVNVS